MALENSSSNILVQDKITIVHGTSLKDIPYTRKTLLSFIKYTAPDVIHEYLFFMSKKAIKRTDFCRKEDNMYETKFKIR